MPACELIERSARSADTTSSEPDPAHAGVPEAPMLWRADRLAEGSSKARPSRPPTVRPWTNEMDRERSIWLAASQQSFARSWTRHRNPAGAAPSSRSLDRVGGAIESEAEATDKSPEPQAVETRYSDCHAEPYEERLLVDPCRLRDLEPVPAMTSFPRRPYPPNGPLRTVPVWSSESAKMIVG